VSQLLVTANVTSGGADTAADAHAPAATTAQRRDKYPD